MPFALHVRCGKPQLYILQQHLVSKVGCQTQGAKVGDKAQCKGVKAGHKNKVERLGAKAGHKDREERLGAKGAGHEGYKGRVSCLYALLGHICGCLW